MARHRLLCRFISSFFLSDKLHKPRTHVSSFSYCYHCSGGDVGSKKTTDQLTVINSLHSSARYTQLHMPRLRSAVVYIASGYRLNGVSETSHNLGTDVRASLQ